MKEGKASCAWDFTGGAFSDHDICNNSYPGEVDLGVEPLSLCQQQASSVLLARPHVREWDPPKSDLPIGRRVDDRLGRYPYASHPGTASETPSLTSFDDDDSQDVSTDDEEALARFKCVATQPTREGQLWEGLVSIRQGSQTWSKVLKTAASPHHHGHHRRGCCVLAQQPPVPRTAQVNNTAVTENSTHVTGGAPTTGSPSSARKRARESGPPEHMKAPSEPDDEPPTKSRKSKAVADERSRIILACPFYKKDPAKYRSCRRFFLTKISYVKQHILRSHRMPPHCQICNRLFQTDEQQLEHVRAQVCERQPYSPPEGVTQAQIALLRGRVDQKKSLEGQWYEIYEILFPGAQRPGSVYLDPELSQDLDEFASFLTSRGPDILLRRVPALSDVLASSSAARRPSSGGESSLASDVSSALQEVYEEWYRTRTRDAPPPALLLQPNNSEYSARDAPSSPGGGGGGSIPTTPSTSSAVPVPSYLSDSNSVPAGTTSTTTTTTTAARHSSSVIAPPPPDRTGPSLAGANRHESSFGSFGSSTPSAFERPSTTAGLNSVPETNRIGSRAQRQPSPLLLQPPTAAAAAMNPTTARAEGAASVSVGPSGGSLKRVIEYGQGGEGRRKSPRPASYKDSGSAGPGSLAERESVGPPSRPDG